MYSCLDEYSHLGYHHHVKMQLETFMDSGTLILDFSDFRTMSQINLSSL